MVVEEAPRQVDTTDSRRRPLAAPMVQASSCAVPTATTTPVTTLLGSPRLVGTSRRGTLPPLEPLEVVAKKHDEYCGPTEESNWVIPGRLMAGAFPGAKDDAEHERLLHNILRAGVTTFVSLQREFDPGATESQWRFGPALRPYFAAAVEVADRMDDEPKRHLSFVHFGIEDCGVADDAAVTDLAFDLAERLRSTAEIVYLHCWGGHGRTGTLVCLLLHLLYGLDDRAALTRCQLCHDMRRVPIPVGSPQTPRQRDQVSRVITRLQLNDAALARKRALATRPTPVLDDPLLAGYQQSHPNSRLAFNQVSFDEGDQGLAGLVANPPSKKPHTDVLPRLPGSGKPHLEAGARQPERCQPRAPAKDTGPTMSKASPRHQRLQQRRFAGGSA